MNERCASCGMTVADGEYHPYASCIMYIASCDAETVRANIDAVREHGAAAMRERAVKLAEEILAERADKTSEYSDGCRGALRELVRRLEAK